MKVRKGGVVISIPPTDLKRYRLSGWIRVDERPIKQIKNMNEKAKLKRLREKGGS